jgi:hypothetical protein
MSLPTMDELKKRVIPRDCRGADRLAGRGASLSLPQTHRNLVQPKGLSGIWRRTLKWTNGGLEHGLDQEECTTGNARSTKLQPQAAA